MGNLAAESAFLDLVGSQRVGAPAGRFSTTFENAFRTHFPERRGLAMHSRTPRVPQSKKKLIELPAEAWRAPNNSKILRSDQRNLGFGSATFSKCMWIFLCGMTNLILRQKRTRVHFWGTAA